MNENVSEKIIELIKENCALDDEVTYNTGFIMSEDETIEDFIKFVEEKLDEKHKC